EAEEAGVGVSGSSEAHAEGPEAGGQSGFDPGLAQRFDEARPAAPFGGAEEDALGADEPLDAGQGGGPGKRQPVGEGQESPPGRDAAAVAQGPHGPEDAGAAQHRREEHGGPDQGAEPDLAVAEKEAAGDGEDGGEAEADEVDEPLETAEKVVEALGPAEVVA